MIFRLYQVKCQEQGERRRWHSLNSLYSKVGLLFGRRCMLGVARFWPIDSPHHIPHTHTHTHTQPSHCYLTEVRVRNLSCLLRIDERTSATTEVFVLYSFIDVYFLYLSRLPDVFRSECRVSGSSMESPSRVMLIIETKKTRRMQWKKVTSVG